MSAPARPRAARAAAPKHGRGPRPDPAAAGRGVAWTFALAAFAVGLSVVQAIRHAWVADDAYISFRYADHLARGLGLVYNPGERVEGYTNFLWTLWCALGLRLGSPAEAWALVWNVAGHAAAVLLLAWPAIARARARRGFEVPLTALALGFHEDWSIFGTSGLETPWFTALVVAGWLALTLEPPRPRRAAIAALLLSLATLTRPDGAVFALLGGIAVLVTARPRGRAVAAYAAVALAIAIPYVAWKLAYYHALLPNTWYAKSGGFSWYAQGLVYLWLYFLRYGVLLVTFVAGVALGVAAMRRRRAAGAAGAAPWAVAAAFALAYLAYVARVGGDFMYARFAIPATPFLLLPLEAGLRARGPRPAWLMPAAAAVVAVALAASRSPLEGDARLNGIVNERATWTDPARAAERRESAASLKRYFAGLPVRYAFVGGQAMLAYASRAPVAIEATAGLTDSLIAHQPLAARGRVGHEKAAPPGYLVERRRVHFWSVYEPTDYPGLDRYVPIVPIRFDHTMALVLTWDPALMAEMRRRGAEFRDFPTDLDSLAPRLPTLPDSTVSRLYALARRLYFDNVHDPAREAPYRQRLGLAAEERSP